MRRLGVCCLTCCSVILFIYLFIFVWSMSTAVLRPGVMQNFDIKSEYLLAYPVCRLL